MAYSFDQIFAADPSNPENVAQNSSVTIFAPGDETQTPLTITDPDGQPLANPLTTNANGFASAFAHETLDRVAWAGGGFTGFFTSYEGMKAEAVAARAAAENAGANAAAAASTALAGAVSDAETAATAANSASASASAAATSAASAAALVGAPADPAIAAAVSGTGTATRSALNAVYPRSSNQARNALDAGIDATGNVDETVKINQFFADCYAAQREAYFPRGVYRYSQLVYPSGLKLRGAGIGGYGIDGAAAGTMFRQTVGANKHGIVFSGNLVSGVLQIGPVDISDIMFRGETSNTSGSAIAFQAADGTLGTIQDTVVIKNCLFRYWPQSGIYSPAGARPFHVQDCNFLWNGEYGIDFIQSTVNYVQAVHFQDISGDGNLFGLIRLKGLDKHGSVTFTSVKSERRVNPITSVAGQTDALIFENCDDAAVTVNGLTHISSVPNGAVHEPPGAAMVVKGIGKPQITWRGVTVRVRATDVAGTPATLKDEALTHSIAEGVREGLYGGTDGKYAWAQSARIDADGLASGESTLSRTDAGISSGNSMTSGTLRMTYKTAAKTEAINTVQIPCGGTAAVATPTLIRAGVYVEETNGDLTLVASSASNTALFAAANTENNIPLTAPFTKIRGKRYAVGLLVVTANTPPTVFGSTSLISSIIGKGPALAAVRTSLTDLPSSVTAAQVASGPSTVRFYAEMLP